MHGGAADDNGEVMYDDAWLYKNQQWTKLPSQFEASARDDHGLVYHRTAKRMIMLEGVSADRGLMVLNEEGWETVEADPLHPRHQTSPLVWHSSLGGVLLYGGEVQHGGPQFDGTLLLDLPAANGN